LNSIIPADAFGSKKKWQRLGLNQRPRAYETSDQIQLLNKITLNDFLRFSKFSKGYISQVKSGYRPPSKRFLKALKEYTTKVKTKRDYLSLFLKSRQTIEVTEQTLEYYQAKLGRFLREVNADKANRQDIETFLLQFENPGNRHAYHRVIKTFYNWREEIYDLPSPVKKLKAPRLGKPILPALTADQVSFLINTVEKVRDKAIIAVFTESGLRLSELANVKPEDIDWTNGTIKVLGKGRKEALAPLGEKTQYYIKIWLQEYQPKETIWGLNKWGITSMLRRLEKTTGITCNPHVFRRTFACLLRKAGLDVMTIKDLGRWESLEMVQRYTRSVTFYNSLKFYKSILG